MDWTGLARGVAGELILAGDERLRLADKQYACALPLAKPQALLRCASVDDVRRAVEFVRRYPVPFAIRSGGHCFGDLSSSEGLVIDLAGLSSVALGEEGIADVGPGALSGDLSRALAAAGRVVPTGGCPLVAIGGLALAGGFGFLGRRHGLAADRVVRLEVVLADGEVVEASAEDNPDLFWALRGGGALGFGIVTRLTLATAPLEPMTVLNGRWPMTEAGALIEAWQAFAPDADETVSLELGLVCPDFLDEPAFVELFGIVAGAPLEAGAHVARVEAWLGPLAAQLSVWQASPIEAADYCVGLLNHRMGPAWLPKRPYDAVGLQSTRSGFFDGPLSAAAIGECVRGFAEDRQHAQLRELELVPWRGAYAPDDGTACFVHRDARMLIRHTAAVGARSAPELRAHTAAWTRSSAAALAPDSNGRAYQGYAEAGRGDWAAACHGARLPRLLEIRSRYDPDRLFARCAVPLRNAAGTSRFTEG
jgi:FAD/FMN-containing dehydrogenase